jgi:chromosome segregation ATPase
MASPPNRRRSRGWRLTLAGALLISAVVATVTALLIADPIGVALAAVAATLLGIAAARLTYGELIESRIEAGAERAELARIYQRLTNRRIEENAEFMSHMQNRLATAQMQLSEVRGELTAARHAVYEAEQETKRQSKRATVAEQEGETLTSQLAEATEREASALMRVHELEAEVDVLRAEVAAWELLREDGSGQAVAS